jgi:hypothetical protein
MSSENTTIIDRIYEAFETRNFLTFFNLLSPAIHITQCPEVPWGGVFHGLVEAKVFFGKVNTYLEDHVAIERVSMAATVSRSSDEVTAPLRALAVASMCRSCTFGDSRMDSPSTGDCSRRSGHASRARAVAQGL